MRMLNRLLLIGLGLSLLAGCGGTDGSERSTADAATPPEPQVAEQTMPRMATDIGKTCTDSDQCEEMCCIRVDDLPKSGKVTGKCSGGLSHWGTDIIEVKNGKAVGRAVIVM